MSDLSLSSLAASVDSSLLFLYACALRNPSLSAECKEYVARMADVCAEALLPAAASRAQFADDLIRGLLSLRYSIASSGIISKQLSRSCESFLLENEQTYGYIRHNMFRVPWWPCEFFQRDACREGRSCRFMHAKVPHYSNCDSSGHAICMYYHFSPFGCHFGETCEFSHQPMCPAKYRSGRTQPARALQPQSRAQPAVYRCFDLLLAEFAHKAAVQSPMELILSTALQEAADLVARASRSGSVDEANQQACNLMLAFFCGRYRLVDRAGGADNIRRLYIAYDDSAAQRKPVVVLLVADPRLPSGDFNNTAGSEFDGVACHPEYPSLPECLGGCPIRVFSELDIADPARLELDLSTLVESPLEPAVPDELVAHAIELNSKRLFAQHRSLVGLSGGTAWRQGLVDPNAKDAVIAFVPLKYLIPIDEPPLPQELMVDGHRVRLDVQEGWYQEHVLRDFLLIPEPQLGISIGRIPPGSELIPPTAIQTDITRSWHRGTIGAYAISDDGRRWLLTNQHVCFRDNDPPALVQVALQRPIPTEIKQEADRITGELIRLQGQLHSRQLTLEGLDQTNASELRRKPHQQAIQQLMLRIEQEESQLRALHADCQNPEIYSYIGTAHKNSATRDSVKWRGQDWGIDVAAVRLDDELFTDPMPVQFNNADMPALNVQPVEYESVFGEDGSFLRARSHVFKQGSTTDVTQGHVWHYVLDHRVPTGDEQDIFIEDGGDGSSFIVRIKRVEGSERVLYRQLLIRPRFLREFTLPGDSGALVVSSTGCPVALLHGGFVHYQGRAGIACDIGACVHYLSTQIGSPLHLTHQL